MTTEETRTRLRRLEDRLGERTPAPIEGQTRIPLPRPTRADDEDERGPAPRRTPEPARSTRPA
ncbi:hypothetical protein [Streptomyces sp. PanSC19]|uniref:hypothetical protein n=1 Tax=Streptomyces sp. PanSC19 TaxID=1520455 RepID=UPI000F4A7694|nr:hypothetical protein [Streptomyces sp. PanSC19]